MADEGFSQLSSSESDEHLKLLQGESLDNGGSGGGGGGGGSRHGRVLELWLE